jgi:hypothetical protein
MNTFVSPPGLQSTRLAWVSRTAGSLSCVLALVSLVGCASAPTVIHEPIRPQRPPLARRRMDGDLVVYSAPRVSWYAQAEYPAYTDYTIYTQDGKLLSRIDNSTGSFNGYPARVALQPGEYRVKALAAGGGYTIVPVIIEAAATTVVNLDGAPGTSSR